MSGTGQIVQTGTITPGHALIWTTDGVAQDGGPAIAGLATEYGVVKNGGIAFAANSGVSPETYTQVGFGVSSTGTVTFYANSFGEGAPEASVYFNINGSVYAFPGSGDGNVVGPISATAGDIAVFNGTTGALLADGGVLSTNIVQGPSSAVSGHVATFNGTGGKLIADGGFSVSSAVQPVLGESTLAAALFALGGASLSAANTFAGLQTLAPGAILAQSGSTALTSTVSGTGTSTSGDGGWFHLFNITSDNINAGGNFVDGLAVGHNYGGSAAQGGRQAIAGQLFFNSATSSSNSNRNYVGVLAETVASAADGGSSGTPQGAFFGLNAVAEVGATTTYALNVTAAEFDVSCATGSSVKYKTGIQVVSVSTDGVHGSSVDAAIVVTAEPGAAGFGVGLQFNAMSGATPIINNGTLIQVEGTGVTLTTGIDLSAWTVTGNLIQGASGGGGMSNTSLTLNGVTTLNATQLLLGGNQVVTDRIHGWTSPTGTVSRATFATGTATTSQLAQALAALIEDLTTHGLIGT
jgi:hypothetical protein